MAIARTGSRWLSSRAEVLGSRGKRIHCSQSGPASEAGSQAPVRGGSAPAARAVMVPPAQSGHEVAGRPLSAPRCLGWRWPVGPRAASPARSRRRPGRRGGLPRRRRCRRRGLGNPAAKRIDLATCRSISSAGRTSDAPAPERLGHFLCQLRVGAFQLLDSGPLRHLHGMQWNPGICRMFMLACATDMKLCQAVAGMLPPVTDPSAGNRRCRSKRRSRSRR